MHNKYKTYRNNHFIGNNQTITACVVRLNNEPRTYGNGDYRVATIEICLNGAVPGDINSGFKLTSVKVFARDSDDSWYIQLPGSFRKTKKYPEGKRFDNVRFTGGQFGSLRSYCYDRTDEELDKVDPDGVELLSDSVASGESSD